MMATEGKKTRKTSKQRQRPVALVTGGASFLGRAISRELAEKGFDLALHYHLTNSKVNRHKTEMENLGSKVITFQADLSRVDKASDLIRRVVGCFHRLDLLVNNASLFYPTPQINNTLKSWQNLFNVNLLTPFALSQAAAPWLSRTAGSIVNLTDIYAENPILRNYSAYTLTKAGLICATKLLARELGPSIRVNAVSPGAIFIPRYLSLKKRKELIDKSILKRQGEPKDIAAAVCFLATQEFVTGQVLKVDGGRFFN